MDGHLEYILAYLAKEWPAFALVLGAVWGALVWLKKQFIDSVYATKQDLRETKEELEDRMDSLDKRDSLRYENLTKTMHDKSDEIKDLITHHLGNKE